MSTKWDDRKKKLLNVDLMDQKFLLIPNLRYLSFSMLTVLNKFFYIVFFVYFIYGWGWLLLMIFIVIVTSFEWIWISKCMYDLHFQLYAHECRFFFFLVFILMECCQHMTSARCCQYRVFRHQTLFQNGWAKAKS